jgi:hypothetical protein
MFAGTASGVFLPPYVVFKRQNVYQSWCTGGPKGTVYTCTPLGWFDNYVFVDWMKKVLIPYCRRLEGKKLLLVDNLSSHISMEVIDLCKECNIELVCLPPNSTDKMQPLDVGIFGPNEELLEGTAAQVPGPGPQRQATKEEGIPPHAQGVD